MHSPSLLLCCFNKIILQSKHTHTPLKFKYVISFRQFPSLKYVICTNVDGNCHKVISFFSPYPHSFTLISQPLGNQLGQIFLKYKNTSFTLQNQPPIFPTTIKSQHGLNFCQNFEVKVQRNFSCVCNFNQYMIKGGNNLIMHVAIGRQKINKLILNTLIICQHYHMECSMDT